MPVRWEHPSTHGLIGYNPYLRLAPGKAEQLGLDIGTFGGLDGGIKASGLTEECCRHHLQKTEREPAGVLR